MIMNIESARWPFVSNSPDDFLLLECFFNNSTFHPSPSVTSVCKGVWDRAVADGSSLLTVDGVTELKLLAMATRLVLRTRKAVCFHFPILSSVHALNYSHVKSEFCNKIA